MNKKYNFDLSKRKFLKESAGIGFLTIAPGIFLQNFANARDPNLPADSSKRWGMLINTNLCDEGCNACVDACNDEHGIEDFGRPHSDVQWIRKLNLVNELTGAKKSIPMMCQHCEHPPCVDVCPTGASFIRADGIVLVNSHTCIGCRYCMMACPYKARSFVHENLSNQLPDVPRGKGCVESCTMCVHRVDRGEKETACSEACKKDGAKAIIFGDLNNPESEISVELNKYGGKAIRADLGLNTAVRYQGI